MPKFNTSPFGINADHAQLRRIYPQADEGQSPREWGIDANTVQVRTINLAVARAAPIPIEVGGNFFWVVDATSLAAAATLYLGDAMIAGDGIPIGQGFQIAGLRFSRIFIANAAQAGETITILVAVDDSRQIRIENPTAAYTNVTLSKSTLILSTADVTIPTATLTQILPGDAVRRDAIIRALSTNTGEIRINEGAAAVRGVYLAPGDSISLQTTDIIYGYHTTGVNQLVSTLYTRD